MPVVQLLHVPVPQSVDYVVEVLKILDKSLPDVEQVIEVPKTSANGLAAFLSRSRSWRNSWWKCRRPSLLSLLCRRRSTSWLKCRLPCLRLSGFSRVMMGTCGGSSLCLRGLLVEGGLLSHPPSHRGTPPGQGGIEILARADCGRPCDSCGLCSSSPSRTSTVPRYSSSTECRSFLLCHRREIPQCSS